MRLAARRKAGRAKFCPAVEEPEAEMGQASIEFMVLRKSGGAVRSERYRYIQYRDDSEEFYDHASDPGEFTNLAENPEYVDIIAKHRAWLPKEDVLPAGTSEWKPDRLDRRLANWLVLDSIPNWLK